MSIQDEGGPALGFGPSGPDRSPRSKGIATLPFAAWLNAIVAAESAGAGMDVPCGDCRGCCTSAYFIHIGPDEKATLSRIPKRLLFPAPGMPKGHFLLGYGENGHCPMFKDNACTIYADRPRTCRSYDCRVFAATGLGEADKPVIAGRAALWRFAFTTDEDERRFKAVRAAAKFLRRHAAEFPEGFVPKNATQQAALAIRVHEAFLERRPVVAEAIAAIVRGAAPAAAKAAGRNADATRSAGAPRPASGSRTRGASRRRPGPSG